MRWGLSRQDWSCVLMGTTPAGTSILLRPLRPEDAHEYSSLRADNRHWLARWDATSPVAATGPRSFEDLVDFYQEEALAGRMLPFVI